MAIEVSNRKKEIKLPKGADLFFHFNIILLILAGIFYGFVYYLNFQAESVSQEIEEFTQARKAEFPEKQEIQLIAQNYANLLNDFKEILSQRREASSFFPYFERLIHPNVSVLSADINLEEGGVSFSGRGRNLVAVGQQFYSLKNNEFALNVSLSGLVVPEEENEESGVNFSFSFDISPEIFGEEVEEI